MVIPPEVERELQGAGAIHKDFDWSLIRVLKPKDSDKVDAVSADLDRGESEALVLAVELKADLLLIDEASGREIATRWVFGERDRSVCYWRASDVASYRRFRASWTDS